MAAESGINTGVFVIAVPIVMIVIAAVIFGGLLLLGKSIGRPWLPLMIVFGVGVVSVFAVVVAAVRWAATADRETFASERSFARTADLPSGSSINRRGRGVIDASPPVPISHLVDETDAMAAAEPISLEGDGPERKDESPEWAGVAQRRVGNTVQMAVDDGPHDRLYDCEMGLNDKLVDATRDYSEEFIASGSGELIAIAPSYIREQFVIDEYVDTTSHSFGPGYDDKKMYRVHLLLQFDDEANEYLRNQLKRSVVDRRLWYTGYGLGSALMMLATVFGYLRIDQATAGKYKGRLKLAAGTVILAVSAAGALLARYIALA